MEISQSENSKTRSDRQLTFVTTHTPEKSYQSFRNYLLLYMNPNKVLVSPNEYTVRRLNNAVWFCQLLSTKFKGSGT